MIRSRTSPARRYGLIAVAALLAAALAATGARLLRRRQGGGSSDGGGRGLRGRFASDRRPRYSCSCGQSYRVTGVDRHRVYWPEGTERDEAVLGDRCIRCEEPLPAGHDTPVVA